jgi:hypothetical protein
MAKDKYDNGSDMIISTFWPAGIGKRHSSKKYIEQRAGYN